MSLVKDKVQPNIPGREAGELSIGTKVALGFTLLMVTGTLLMMGLRVQGGVQAQYFDGLYTPTFEHSIHLPYVEKGALSTHTPSAIEITLTSPPIETPTFSPTDPTLTPSPVGPTPTVPPIEQTPTSPPIETPTFLPTDPTLTPSPVGPTPTVSPIEPTPPPPG